MKQKKFKFLLIILLAITIGILVVPSYFYIQNFGSNNLSNNTSDWGTFGDYFGGTTNTIISLFSLFILTYITVQISKFSSEENKNLFLLQKRIEAYDEFSKYAPQNHVIAKGITQTIERINVLAIREGLAAKDKIDNLLDEVHKEVMLTHEYHYFLFNFHPRYGHLFKYNFESKDYKKLVDTSKDFSDSMETFYKKLVNGEDLNDDIQDVFDKHLPYLVNFMNGLQEEL